MQHEEGHFTGLYGTQIYWQNWQPDATPYRGVLVVAHGVGEHSGRYGNVVDAVVPAGFAVYALDHRGHGKSGGLKGHIERFDDFVEDLHTFVTQVVQPRSGNLPLFLLGHSMGSVISMHYLGAYPEGLTGCALSGTGSQIGGDVSPLLRASSKILSRLLPKMRIVAIKDQSFISHDPEVVKAYVNDPLVFADVTARLGSELLLAAEAAPAQLATFRKPVWIACGRLDTSFTGQEGLFECCTAEDKCFHYYEDAFHEVFNEVESIRLRAVGDLVEWLKDHTAA